MKLCLCCHRLDDSEGASCAYCGEASWRAIELERLATENIADVIPEVALVPEAEAPKRRGRK